jgi:hypothetical protein
MWSQKLEIGDQKGDWLGMVVHTCSSSIQEAKAGGSQVQSQTELHRENFSLNE